MYQQDWYGRYVYRKLIVENVIWNWVVSYHKKFHKPEARMHILNSVSSHMSNIITNIDLFVGL